MNADKGYTFKDFVDNLRLAADIARSQLIDDYDGDDCHFEYYFYNFIEEAFAQMILDYRNDHKIDLDFARDLYCDPYFAFPTEWEVI